MDENLRDHSSLCRYLAPLDEVEAPEPPADLVLNTLIRLAEQQTHQLPQAPHRQLTPTAPPERRVGRWAEWLVAASIGLIAIGLGTCALVPLWHRQQVTACQHNLASLGLTLVQYGKQHQGAFPAARAVPGPEGVAAVYVPLLYQAGFQQLQVGCPAQGKKEAPQWDLASLHRLHRDDPDAFARTVRELSGDFAYTLGYRDSGRLIGPRLDSGAEVPLVGDIGPINGVGNSPNHGGRGQNVLFIGGHVRWLVTPETGASCDELYLNREHRVKAGVDPLDYVLAPGDASP